MSKATKNPLRRSGGTSKADRIDWHAIEGEADSVHRTTIVHRATIDGAEIEWTQGYLRDGPGGHVIAYAESIDEATALIEEASEPALPGDDVVDRVRALQARRLRDEGYRKIADRLFEDPGGPFDDEAHGGIEEEQEAALQHFFDWLRAAGWSMGADGRVVGDWRKRATRQWIEKGSTFPGYGESWLRIRHGLTLSIWPGEQDGCWSIRVGDEYVGELNSLDDAKEHAVRVADRRHGEDR